MSKNDVHALGIILYPDSTSYNALMQLCRIIRFYGDKAKICWIIHQPEPNAITGVDCKIHYHVLIVVNGNISIEKFQRDFDITGHCVEPIKDYRQFVRYLVHNTPDSCNKIQYPISALHSNFDLTPIFESKIDYSIPEIDMVLDITEWAVKNKASIYQILWYVKMKQYPWPKFRMNSSLILKAVEDEILSGRSCERIHVVKS